MPSLVRALPLLGPDDRGGELDKLLATGEQWESEYLLRERRPDPRYHPDSKKRKRGFLGEVFDIFD